MSERIVIRVDNKLISVLPIRSQIFMKLFRDSPFQCKELLLVRMVSLLSLIHGSASISHWMVSTIVLLLRENGPEAFPRGVHLQQERFLEVRKASTGAFMHFSLRILNASRASGDNFMSSDFLSLLSPLIKSYKGAAMCETMWCQHGNHVVSTSFNETPVVTNIDTRKGPDVSVGLRR